MQGASTSRDPHVATAVRTAGTTHVLITIHGDATEGSNSIRWDVPKAHIEASHGCHDAAANSENGMSIGGKSQKRKNEASSDWSLSFASGSWVLRTTGPIQSDGESGDERLTHAAEFGDGGN